MMNGQAANDPDACTTRNCMDSEFNTLDEFMEGANVTASATAGIKKLSSIGLVREGFTERPTDDGKILIIPTARGTAFAKHVANIRK